MSSRACGGSRVHPYTARMVSIRSLLLVLLPFAVVLAGCPSDDTEPDDDDSAEQDGRIQVVGTGFYDTIQEAVDAAPEGGTVLLGAGCYDEWVVINKPLSISGDSSRTTVITGGGAGTAITVEGVTTGPVTINSLLVRVPYDEPATLRNLRVTGSNDVLIHDTVLSFEDALAPDAEDDLCERVYLSGQTTGDCDKGLLGIDISQSTLLVSETTISCIGFSSENGGSGIVAQTNSDLTVTDSEIVAVGSFGIHTVDTKLTVNDVSISGVNRSPAAQDFESDGTAIFVESGTDEVVVNGLSVENGSYAGMRVESPTLKVSGSTFNGYAFGIFMPGDVASASGRRLTLTDTTFTDVLQEAVRVNASATILGSDFRIENLVPPNAGGTPNGGVRIIGSGTINEVSNNTFDGLSGRALGFYGSSVDGDVAQVTAEANVITNVIAGNGIDVQYVDEALLRGNLIEGVDHSYNSDPANPGSINTGFGIDCFFVGDCELEENTVIGAEFGEFVIVGSSFSSTDDTAAEGMSRGFHIETSQGTFTNPTVIDQLGFGILALDTTLEGEGGIIADTLRGPNIQDIDGNADPLPGEVLYIQGGVSLYVLSQGAPTFLLWEDGTFAGSASSAVTTQDAQVQLIGNDFLGSGFVDENGFYPNAAVYVSGNDPQALVGPIFANNVVDGGEGSYGVHISQGRDLTFSGNTVCAGSAYGVYLVESAGALVQDSLIGATDDPEVAACDSLLWSRGIFISQTEPAYSDEGVTLRDLIIEAPMMEDGVYITGLGVHTIEDVTITNASGAGIYATMSLPAGLTRDQDDDLWRPYQGDCDDTNPLIGFENAVELPDDGLDNDCDGVTDDGENTDDSDGDGYSIADGDCNDTDANVHPGMTEQIDNFRDDNCDGWADFDGEYDWPELLISGTTIDGATNALWLSGVTARLLDPVDDGAVNAITNAAQLGASVSTWQWSPSPMVRPGSLEIGGQTVFGPTGSHCISLVSTGASATLDGTTLQACGGHGLSLTGAGVVSLSDVTIDAPGGSGVYAINGALDAANLAVPSPGESGLYLAGFSAQVNVAGLQVTGGTDAVTQLAGTLVLDGLVSDGTAHSGIAVGGGTGTFTNLGIQGAGSHGVEVSGGVVTLVGGSIGAVDEDGLHQTGFGTVTATDVSVVGAVGHGVSLAGGTLDWNGGSIAGVLEDGFTVSSGTAEVDSLDVVAPGGAGFSVSGGTLLVTGGSVSDAGAEGVVGSGGTLGVDGLAVSDSGGHGVLVEGTVVASVQGAVLSDNGGYGLSCDGGSASATSSSVTLSICEAEVSGNDAGDFELFDGCELAAVCSALTP